MPRTRWLIVLAASGLVLATLLSASPAQMCPWALQFQKFNMQQQGTWYHQQQSMQYQTAMLQRQQMQYQMLQRQQQMLTARRMMQMQRPPITSTTAYTRPLMRPGQTTMFARTYLNRQTLMPGRPVNVGLGYSPMRRPMQPQRIVTANMMLRRISRPPLYRPGTLTPGNLLTRQPMRVNNLVRMPLPPQRLMQSRPMTVMRPQVMNRPIATNRPINVNQQTTRTAVTINVSCNRCHHREDAKPLAMPALVANPMLRGPEVRNPLPRAPVIALPRAIVQAQVPVLPLVVPPPRLALLVPAAPPGPELPRPVAAPKARSMPLPVARDRTALTSPLSVAPNKAHSRPLVKENADKTVTPVTSVRVHLETLLYPWLAGDRESAVLLDTPQPAVALPAPGRETLGTDEDEWPALPPLTPSALLVPPDGPLADLWADPTEDDGVAAAIAGRPAAARPSSDRDLAAPPAPPARRALLLPP